MEGQRQKTVRTERLPAAMLANGKRCRAATVVKNESLMMIIKVLFDGGKKVVGEIAIFRKSGWITEVDYMHLGRFGSFFGFFIKRDEGRFVACEVVICD